jgi:predicted transcriptional regulator
MTLQQTRSEALPTPDERPILRLVVQTPDGAIHSLTVSATFQPSEANLHAWVEQAAQHSFPAIGCQILAAQRVVDLVMEI